MLLDFCRRARRPRKRTSPLLLLRNRPIARPPVTFSLFSPPLLPAFANFSCALFPPISPLRRSCQLLQHSHHFQSYRYTLDSLERFHPQSSLWYSTALASRSIFSPSASPSFRYCQQSHLLNLVIAPNHFYFDAARSVALAPSFNPYIYIISSTAMSSTNQAESVRVVIQARPLLPFEVAHNAHDVLSLSIAPPLVSVQRAMGPDQTFSAFDAVFPPEPNRPPDSLYDAHVAPLLESLFTGLNATVFAYGQTSAGKSYSMRHVTQRVASDLFRRKRAAEADGSTAVSVRVGFVEIYRENIRDLVDGADAVAAPVRVQVRERITKSGRTVFLDGARERCVDSENALMAIVREASLMRRTAATGMNASSSRSHSIITISVLQESLGDTQQSCLAAKLHLVDLAGSERAKRTAAGGERFAEGVEINKGLFALAKVISTLADNASKPPAARVHVPYRDSKLTRLLQDSLGGNARTLLIACVSPADTSREETLGTLRYAERARCIRNKPTVNTDANAVEVSDLRAALSRARAQIAELLADNERLRNRLGARRRSAGSSVVTPSPRRPPGSPTIDDRGQPSDVSMLQASVSQNMPTADYNGMDYHVANGGISTRSAPASNRAVISADGVLSRPPTRRMRPNGADSNMRDIDTNGVAPPLPKRNGDDACLGTPPRSTTAPSDTKRAFVKAARRAVDTTRLQAPTAKRRARQALHDAFRQTAGRAPGPARRVRTRADTAAARAANATGGDGDTEMRPVRSKSAVAIAARAPQRATNAPRRIASTYAPPNGRIVAASSTAGAASLTFGGTKRSALEYSPRARDVSKRLSRLHDEDEDGDEDEDDVDSSMDAEELGRSVETALSERRLEQMKRTFTERLEQTESDKHSLDEERLRLARELSATKLRMEREMEDLKAAHQSRIANMRTKMADVKRLEAESARLAKLRDGSDAAKKKLLGRVAAAERARDGLMSQLSEAVARSEGVRRALGRENRELSKNERLLRSDLQRSETGRSKLEAVVNKLRLENESMKARLIRQNNKTGGGMAGASEVRRANSAMGPGSGVGRTPAPV